MSNPFRECHDVGDRGLDGFRLRYEENAGIDLAAYSGLNHTQIGTLEEAGLSLEVLLDGVTRWDVGYIVEDGVANAIHSYGEGYENEDIVVPSSMSLSFHWVPGAGTDVTHDIHIMGVNNYINCTLNMEKSSITPSVDVGYSEYLKVLPYSWGSELWLGDSHIYFQVRERVWVSDGYVCETNYTSVALFVTVMSLIVALVIIPVWYIGRKRRPKDNTP